MTMRKMTLGVLVFLLSLIAQASELSEKQRSSEYVLMMRHTSAPGVGDPINYTLDDCRTQRNLSPEGREQAVFIGDWLKKQGVWSADVYSSTWCRCKDTAALLNFGGFRVEPALASFFDEMSNAPERNLALKRFISEKIRIKGEKVVVMVTHHVNIFEFTGENVASGDMVLVKVDAGGGLVSYRIIPRPN